jgi:hypothetical protein
MVFRRIYHRFPGRASYSERSEWTHLNVATPAPPTNANIGWAFQDAAVSAGRTASP